MPCIPIPKPPIPSLPDKINITAPLPSFPSISTPNVCCLLPVQTIPKPPIALPPLLVNLAFVATLRAGLQVVEDFIDSLPLDCPRS